MTKKTNILAATSVMALALVILPFGTAFAANPSTTTIEGEIQGSLTLDSSSNTGPGGSTVTDNVNLTALPTGSPVTSSGKNTITVSTNDVSGYHINLEMTSANQSLTGYTGDAAAGPATIAQSSNGNTPGALGLNQWGYHVDGLTIAGGAFDTGIAPQSSAANGGGTYKWAAVPALNSPVSIKSHAGAIANDPTDVWYAINVDATKPSGKYHNTVRYTAVAGV